MVEAVDTSGSRGRDALQKNGLAENTLFVFTSTPSIPARSTSLATARTTFSSTAHRSGSSHDGQGLKTGFTHFNNTSHG